MSRNKVQKFALRRQNARRFWMPRNAVVRRIDQVWKAEAVRNTLIASSIKGFDHNIIVHITRWYIANEGLEAES
jgi:hypothetical protein